MDRILISDLRARCILGVDEEERREKQEVVINLALSTDLRKAGSSDRFEETVDYRALKKRIVSMVEGSQYHLVEALAEAVAGICLEHAAGSSLAGIARGLNRDRVPTVQGGREWWPSTVKAVLDRSSPLASAQRAEPAVSK